MKTELEGLEKLQAWSYPEKVPASANVVSVRWVYAWKSDEEDLKRDVLHGDSVKSTKTL